MPHCHGNVVLRCLYGHSRGKRVVDAGDPPKTKTPLVFVHKGGFLGPTVPSVGSPPTPPAGDRVPGPICLVFRLGSSLVHRTGPSVSAVVVPVPSVSAPVRVRDPE